MARWSSARRLRLGTANRSIPPIPCASGCLRSRHSSKCAGRWRWTAMMPAKRLTPMRKLECRECGNTARVARSWLDVGLPSCPCGGEILPTAPCDLAYIGRITAEDCLDAKGRPGAQWTAICRLNGWEDAIVRRSPGRGGSIGDALARDRREHERRERRTAPAEHCIHPGCPRWVKRGADHCAAGHPQRDGVGSAAAEMPF